MVCRLIIADADTSHAQALAAYLERLDYETTLTGSGEGLQSLIAALLPDIIMVDANLLDSDLTDWLRLMPQQYPLSRTIVLSPSESLDKVLNSLAKTVFGYITKPVKSQMLDHLLHQARQGLEFQRQLDAARQELQELHLTQKHYRQLFDEMPCYLSVQDRDLRITASNRQFKEHFGDEIGCQCYQIYKHRDTPCQECPVADTFKDGRPRQTEEVVTSKTGEHYNILTWTAPIRNRAGEIVQVMEMATDITQIRQLQDHLTSLGLMLGSMSHGVKGMLTALDGAVYQLESGLVRQDWSRIETATGETREMVDRIRKMVLQILYYAKSRELSYETVALSDLAEAVMASARPLAAKHGVALELILAPHSESIDVDRQWLQAALLNLVENAIDACVGVPPASPKAVNVSFRSEDHQMIFIEIKDTGKGMDQETQEKLFTLFFSSKGSQGTGLGLFIAHHVITLHGGSIVVNSAPGQGARFDIHLPRRRPLSAKPRPV